MSTAPEAGTGSGGGGCPAEGSQDQRGGLQRQTQRRSVIAPRAAEVISAYVASAELAARGPPPLWGAGLCSYSAGGVASGHSVRPAPPEHSDQNCGDNTVLLMQTGG